MQVFKRPIIDCLNKSVQFTIPLYQRDYAWKIENCKQLWDDIVSLKDKEDIMETHFLGTLVSQKTKNNKEKEYLIIDGQQRLTTIFLLLLALKKCNNDQDLEIEINTILNNKNLHTKESKLKLKPNKKDRESFNNITEGNTSDKDTNITKNYQFFLKQINENTINLIHLYNLIMDRLEIIDIELDQQDDAQLIFENINATGVHLSPKDQIRNYLLMGLSDNEMEHNYNDYWLKIEENVSDVDTYIHHFLIYKFQDTINENAIYKKLKQSCFKYFDKDKIKLLKELYNRSLIYKRLETGNSNLAHKEDKQIDEKLYRLKSLNITSFYPVYLSIINAKEQGKITSENIIELLNIIECFMIRNIICGGSNKNFNKHTIPLLKIEFDNNYINTFVNKLFIKSGIPHLSNEYFEDAFRKYNFYASGNTKSFVLEHLENDNSDYPVDFSGLTIEHIMPQKITENWKEELGENWESTYNKYVHTIGNLTVVTKSKNSKSSNLPISEKYKLLDLKLTLNQTINKENWNEKLIVNRANILLEKALKIWRYPKFDLNRNINQVDYFSIDEVESNDEIITGKKPAILKIRKESGEVQEIKVKHWKDLTTKVLQELYEYSPTEFVQLKQITSNKADLRSEVEVIPGYYYESNKSSNYLFKLILTIIKELSYDINKISFSIEQDTDSQE